MNTASPEPASAVAVPLGPGVPAAATRGADYFQLTKPRLNFLVVLTTLAGFYLGVERFDLALLFHTIVGTALVAGGSAAFNQVLERDIDGLMRRTRTRPLPGGRLDPRAATVFAAVLSAAGLIQLALGAGPLAASVAFVTLVTYIAVYTPMKRRSPLSTLVGGVPGALPAVIGWAAARNNLSIEAWVLFGIVFLWQMPHFLAIAWMYREDYARARLPMLPVVEPDGRSTAAQVVLYTATLLPVGVLPAVVGLSGPIYLTGALISGLVYFALGLQFARQRTKESARRLFFGSITYLPVILALLLVNRV